jgi:hypothetical protein
MERSLSVDALLERLLESDREMAALHARSTRVLAELNGRANEVGARHSVPEPRAKRPSSLGERDGEASDRERLGARLIVAEIAVARRVSESSVRAQLDDASRLSRLPSALAALEEGLISPAHARVLADGVMEVPAEAVAQFEALVLPSALAGTPAQTRRRGRALRERLHPISIDIRAARRRRERRIAFEPDRDGMAWLHLHLPCADARGAFERVDAAARSLASAPHEHRTLGQIRADVAADLLLSGDVEETGDSLFPPAARAGAAGKHDSAGSGRTRERRGRYSAFHPTVRITVPALTLLGESDVPATLEGYGPIPTGVAEEIAASAPSFTRVLTHPETGTTLSVGRASYAVPADLRRFVQLRDARCRFPGCERTAKGCDIDHTRSWEHGGETSDRNLACLCRAHHRLKHQTAWHVSRLPGGSADLAWTSPFGRTLVDSPDPPF